MNKVKVSTRSGLELEYSGVRRIRVDREGNLRIYRKKLDYVFHPIGEWYNLTLYADLDF